MGAWSDLTLPIKNLHSINRKDFKSYSQDIEADNDYLTSAKHLVRSILRSKLSTFIATLGDETFFDNLAVATSLLPAIYDALAQGFAHSYYNDKFTTTGDQWHTRMLNAERMVKMSCDGIASQVPAALGMITGSPEAPQASVVVTGIGPRGNTTYNNY